MCNGIGLNPMMMMSPMYMSGGFGGFGLCSPSIWGWGGGCCCDSFSTKPMMFGMGAGIGYGLAEFAIAGTPKLVNWISGLFSKKGKTPEEA